MTLSTKAEHVRSLELDLIEDEVATDISVQGLVEEQVMDLEGTEEDPAEVDVEYQVRLISETVEEKAEDVAGRYTEHASDKRVIAQGFGEDAEELARGMLRGAPTVTEAGR